MVVILDFTNGTAVIVDDGEKSEEVARAAREVSDAGQLAQA